MLRLSCFPSFVRCELQCRSSRSIIPKYLTWDEALMFWLLIRKLRCLVITLFLDLNVTSSVLLVFKDSLFSLMHSTITFKFLFICFFIFFIDLSVRIRLVSSAKRWIELNSTALCKSLINNIDRKGPKTDPGRTPYFKYFLLDWYLFTVVNCNLSFRHDWNHGDIILNRSNNS